MKKKILLLWLKPSKKEMAKKKELSYTEAMAEIEQTLQRFRNEELSVDELSKCVKRTSELIAACKAELRKVEEEVSEILKE